ncbi:hypothetical protein PGTUg99_012532, partial [Puccinia graminis f. sp. tritici]
MTLSAALIQPPATDLHHEIVPRYNMVSKREMQIVLRLMMSWIRKDNSLPLDIPGCEQLLLEKRGPSSFIRWLAGGTWTLSGIKLATGTGGGRSRSSTAQILLRFSNAQLQHLGPRDGAIDT